MMRFYVGAMAAAMLAGLFPVPASAQAADGLTATQEFSAQQRRKRITVYPRSRTALGPNSVRQCRTRLQPEYRQSGTVIFPRTVCWWE